MTPRSCPRLLAVIATVVLVMTACASTTVIQQGEPTPDEPTPSRSDTTATDDTAATATDDTMNEDTATEDTAATGDTDDLDQVDEPVPGLATEAQLASLTADCSAGSDPACDILFQVSDLDSVEEDLALSCGGRAGGESIFCTQGIKNEADSLWFDEDSDGLPAVVTACEDGDMTACDFLFFRSALGSEYEEIGTTCAGRVAVAYPDCRTAFPDR